MPRVRFDSAGASAAFTGQEAVSWVSGGATVEVIQGVIKTLTAQQWSDAPQAIKDACSLLTEPATSPGDAAALTSAPVATPDGADAGTTQTLANALKVAHNAAQVDIAALRTKLNALIDALATAGITV